MLENILNYSRSILKPFIDFSNVLEKSKNLQKYLKISQKYAKNILRFFKCFGRMLHSSEVF